MSILTQARLKEMVQYDPVSGLFTWLEPYDGKYSLIDLAWLYVYGEYKSFFVFTEDTRRAQITMNHEGYGQHGPAWLTMDKNNVCTRHIR